MAEKPIRIETFMREGSDQVMFTVVYADGGRQVYWLPFWRALWHCVKLMWLGVKMVETSDV